MRPCSRWVTFVTGLSLAALFGCEDGTPAVRRAEASPSGSAAARLDAPAEAARLDSIVRSRPGYVIDSILPVDEEIRRFQAKSGASPAGFANGAPSRTQLVARFVKAIEDNDTTALASLVVDRAEFGYLVYPTSANAHPPYHQPPEIVWMLRSAATDKGAGRLLKRFGGRPLGVGGYTCPQKRPRREGENTIWSNCVVRVGAGTSSATYLRLFGPIIERGGRYKFLSLANGL